MRLCVNEIAHLALQGWPTSTQPDGTLDAQIAVAVALAESGGDTYAIGTNVISSKPSSGSQDLGLWQINNWYHREKLLRTPAWRDPWVALSLAVQVWHEGGWKLWATFNGSSPTYLRWMPAAGVGLLQPIPPPGGTPTPVQKTALGLSPAAPPRDV